MIESALLKDIPSAMSLPFPEMLYIEAKTANTEVTFNLTLTLFKSSIITIH